MPAATHDDTTALSILNTAIRQDAQGRFSLNDCHQAAGGDPSKRPGYWLANQQTIDLIAELKTAGIPAIKTEVGRKGGTYVAKELVYAYGMWISPAFHLKVIRAFDAYATGQKALPSPEGAIKVRTQHDEFLAKAELFSPRLLAEVMARAEELALASIPKLQHELLRQVVLKLAADEPIDLQSEYYRTSLLRRFKAGSIDEEKYLVSQWAWEIVPDPRNAQGRAEIESVIRRVIARS